ncbi:MAG: nucleotidyltransferase family protein [Idiomarina sp.]|nr:nucleotidyltransferase family protein [Idiomarina sp.]
MTSFLNLIQNPDGPVSALLVQKPELMKALRYHQLIPFIQEARQVPQLKPLHIQNLKRAHKQQQSKSQLTLAFAEMDIDARWFKGHTLTDKLYKTPASRYASDLDVLLPRKASVVKAALYLIDQGWRCPFEHNADIAKQINDYLKTHKDLPLRHPASGTVELHYRITAAAVPISAAFERWLWQCDNSQLSCEELLYLCYHGSVTAYHRLKWLYDIHLYLEAWLKERTTEELLSFAKKTDTLRPLLLSWGLACRVFNTQMPVSIARQIHKSWLVRWGMQRVLLNAEKCSGQSPSLMYRFERRLFWYLAHQKPQNQCKVGRSVIELAVRSAFRR